MTIQAVAQEFTELLKQGRHQEAADRFNADDIVSLEAMDGPMARIEGRAAVKAKSDWWYANHEVHGGSAEGPFINGDQFVVVFGLEVTPKETGQRMSMREVGLYTVRNGRIAQEQFFYGM